jgi:pimeloyl-ACP methyl ester carboxylesterase
VISTGDVDIWYEYLAAKSEKKGTLLLIMGLANDALTWPDDFIDLLRVGGYDVIRFDNRDVGMSTWVTDWDKSNQYDLSHMADDTITLMNHLNLEKAHLVGVSMGGMIAQTVAINYPDRVLSMTSMMSSGDTKDKSVPQADKWMIAKFLLAEVRYRMRLTEENMIKRQLTAWHLLRGDQDYEINIKNTAETVLKNLRYRNGYNPKASKQQLAAIYNSGSRYDALKKIQTPTLIVHGINDPLLKIEHGYKCAEVIPDAQFLWVDQMGHTLPDKHFNEIVDAILLRMESI